MVLHMVKIETVIAVLLSVANVSCATLALGKSKDNPTKEPIVEVKTVIQKETEYLPAKTVIQPFPEFPNDFPKEIPYLSDEYLTGSGDDIDGLSAVGVGVNWAEQYHDLGNDYMGVVRWYQGLIDGQKTTQEALDKDFEENSSKDKPVSP